MILDTTIVKDYQKTIDFIDGKLYKKYYTLANFLYFKSTLKLKKDEQCKRKTD